MMPYGDKNLTKHWFRSVMACFAMASIYYLNQCWLMTKCILWYLHENSFTRNGHDLNWSVTWVRRLHFKIMPYFLGVMMTSSVEHFPRYCPFVRVTGEFPSQRQVTQSFDVFFDLRLNKRFRKQSRRWWFEMPSFSLWRHCYGDELNISHNIICRWMLDD